MSLSRLTALWTALLVTAVAAEEAANKNECGLYLAPSSTQETDATTIWGLYAGKEIAAGEKIGSSEVAINLHHFKANAVVDEKSPSAAKSEGWQAAVDFAESYIWVPAPVGARFEQDEGRLVSAVPGAGVLSAFDMKLTNANWYHHAAYRPPAWNTQPGVPHPGRGAQSPFYQATIEATADIAKGSEIFMDYGENWAEEEKREALLLEDFKNLDATIDKMIKFFDKHSDLHESSKASIYDFLIKDVMIAAVGHHKAKTVAKLLPKNPDDLKDVNFFVVAVPTPIDDANLPNLRPLLGASATVGKVLKKGDYVVFESTVYPGCTEEDCIPVLQAESGLKYKEDFMVDGCSVESAQKQQQKNQVSFCGSWPRNSPLRDR